MKTLLFACFLFPLALVAQNETPPPVERVILEEPAEFPGGMAALKAYLEQNVMMPQRAIDEYLEGKCYVQFHVLEDGAISNARVVRGVKNCPECDEEALRVVKAMPNWKPGKRDGVPVKSTFNLPVIFQFK